MWGQGRIVKRCFDTLREKEAAVLLCAVEKPTLEF